MPRGLKPAPLLAVGGTAEALPFPKPFVRRLYAGKYCFWKLENFRTLASESENICGSQPYVDVRRAVDEITVFALPTDSAFHASLP